MTIAACFVTSGGVVLGADSTQTFTLPSHAGSPTLHYFNHAQKLFEIGEGSSLGVITWGLGGFDGISYRKTFAELGDRVATTEPGSVQDVVASFVEMFWGKYSAQASTLAPLREEAAELTETTSQIPEAEQRLKAERRLVELRQHFQVGFCLGGHARTDRTPAAFSVVFSPEATVPPIPQQVGTGSPVFWGVPDIVRRIIYGIDPLLAERILKSCHWGGTDDDLVAIIKPFVLRTAEDMPIREAIDYVHSAISMTCKGLKFSHLDPVCGGPVEVAVITADRRFRWVTHKSMEEALL